MERTPVLDGVSIRTFRAGGLSNFRAIAPNFAPNCRLPVESKSLAAAAVTGLEAERVFCGRTVMEIRHDPFCFALCCAPTCAV